MRLRPVFLFLILLLSVVVAACGSDNSDHSTNLSMDAEPADEAAVEPSSSSAGDRMSASGDAESPTQLQATSIDRRVIRNAEIELEVENIESSTRQFREIVADLGGYMTSSSAQTTGESRARTYLSFEVPADRFETTLDRLRDHRLVVEVLHESTTTQDVTEEYVDLESRLRNLEATEERYVELLEAATTISEILDVEYELSRVRGDIEQLQGRINYLDQRTSFSRISVTLEETQEDNGPIGGQPFSPGETAREAWDASMQFIGNVASAAITVVVFFWWAWPIVALMALLVSRYRRRGRVEQQPA
jgi:hypothetical protein